MADLGAYDFTQGSANTTWTINHNLGTKDVVVDAMVDAGSPAELTKANPATVTTTGTTQVVLTWSVAQSGSARVVGGGDD